MGQQDKSKQPKSTERQGKLKTEKFKSNCNIKGSNTS